jgi:hypothetical protein
VARPARRPHAAHRTVKIGAFGHALANRLF